MEVKEGEKKMMRKKRKEKEVKEGEKEEEKKKKKWGSKEGCGMWRSVGEEHMKGRKEYTKRMKMNMKKRWNQQSENEKNVKKVMIT